MIHGPHPSTPYRGLAYITLPQAAKRRLRRRIDEADKPALSAAPIIGGFAASCFGGASPPPQQEYPIEVPGKPFLLTQ